MIFDHNFLAAFQHMSIDIRMIKASQIRYVQMTVMSFEDAMLSANSTIIPDTAVAPFFLAYDKIILHDIKRKSVRIALISYLNKLIIIYSNFPQGIA